MYHLNTIKRTLNTPKRPRNFPHRFILPPVFDRDQPTPSLVVAQQLVVEPDAQGQVGDLYRPDLVLADVEVGDRRPHEGRGVTRHPGMKNK